LVKLSQLFFYLSSHPVYNKILTLILVQKGHFHNANKQARKQASTQTSKHANKQARKQASTQTSKHANKQARKQASTQTSKQYFVNKSILKINQVLIKGHGNTKRNIYVG
jgi:hypothetical protein